MSLQCPSKVLQQDIRVLKKYNRQHFILLGQVQRMTLAVDLLAFLS